MSFCTAINCMDGRVQAPVIEYLQERFGVEFVDKVTKPGPVRILAEEPDSDAARLIFESVGVSLDAHQSCGIAIAAHHDCAGNPVDESTQRAQLNECLRILADRYPDTEIIGVWVDASWTVHELPAAARAQEKPE